MPERGPKISQFKKAFEELADEAVKRSQEQIDSDPSKATQDDYFISPPSLSEVDKSDRDSKDQNFDLQDSSNTNTRVRNHASQTENNSTEPPWFEGRQLTRSKNDMTPVERVLDNKIRERLTEMLGDTDTLASAVDAIAAAEGLPKVLKQEVAAKMDEVREMLQTATPEQVSAWVQEAQAVVEEGDALGPLAAKGNPAARGALTALAAFAQSDYAAKPDTKKTERPSRISNFNAPLAQSAALGTAAGLTYLSWAVTRAPKYLESSAASVRDLMASGAGLIDGQARDYIASLPPNVIASIEAGVISAGISAVIFTYRGERFGSLHPAKQLAYALALGSSMGLGLLKMQTSIKDSGYIATLGAEMSRELSGMKGGVESLQQRLSKLVDTKGTDGKVTEGALKRITRESLDSEVNNPNRPGYYLNSIVFDYVYTGSFDESKFQSFMDEKKMTEQSQTVSKQKRDTRISAIDKIKEKHGITTDLRTLVANMTNELDINDPLKLYSRAEQTAETQKNSTAIDHFISNFSPAASVSPETMKMLRTDLINSFIGLIKKYDDITTSELPKLEAFARDIKTETGVDISDVILKIKAEFKPLPVTAASLEAMLTSGATADREANTLLPASWSESFMSSTFMVDVKDLIVPDARVIKEFQASVEKAGISFPDMEKNIGWYYLLITLLATLYVGFDLIPKPAQDAARKRSERVAREKLPGELDKVNDLEASITRDIVDRTQFSFKVFERALAGTDSPVTRQMPELVSELHVRTELRRLLGKGLPGADEEIERRFRRRLLDTEKHVDLYNEYRNRLLDLEKRLQKDPATVTAELMCSLYPSHDAVVAALGELTQADVGSEAYQQATENLERSYGTVRVEQLRAQASALRAHLDRLHLKEKSLRETLGDEEGTRDAHELARQTVIRFDTAPGGKRDFSVPREVAVEAYALTQVSSEILSITETLEQIEELGIEIEQYVDTSGVTSPEFTKSTGLPNLELTQAIADQLRRSSIEDVVGTPDVTGKEIAGTAEDFKRFDTYMADINNAFRELQAEAIDTNDHFEDTTPVFEWKLNPATNRFTAFLELRSKDEFGEAAALLVYPGNIPDFSKSSSELIEDIRNWFFEKNQVIEGLVAQVENHGYHKEHEQHLAAFTKLRGGSTDLHIIEAGKTVTNSKDERDLIERLYTTNAILKDQHPLMPLARNGHKIESTKFLHFIDPASIRSPHGYARLTAIFEDIQGQRIPEELDVVYDAATERIEVYRQGKKRWGTQPERDKVMSTHIDQYSRRELLHTISNLFAVEQ